MAAGPTITWEVPVALLAHVALFAIVMVARCSSSSEEPLFKPEDTIQVALSGPPKNVTRMPQKAERAPEAPKAAASDPTAQPPPPNPSDMAFKTPDAPKTKGDPNADALQKTRDELRMRQALDNLSAPVGEVDRLASNPDGVEGDEGTTATSGLNDPELARWQVKAREKVGVNWHPLRSICVADPTLAVLVAVDVDANGTPQGAPTIKTRSGNVSFDEAAKRAVEATGPLPKPPARFTDGLIATLKFTGKECQ
ncbi:MAG: TonB family protein [Pseudomonadota bacterium]|nr:TonB family protein [Pseudomonadota bacterium]